MSVYTSISEFELEQFLLQYDVGNLESYSGISAGIENTNYFVDTLNNGIQQRFVLTIFETYSAQEMPFFLGLMKHIADADVPSAHPIASLSGELLLELKGKPAALVERLNGGDIKHPNTIQLEEIGRAMAQMHLAGQDYTGQRANCRGINWWEGALQRLQDKLPDDEAQLIQAEIGYQKAIDRSQLPAGVIHADLFHDNALFDGDQLAGIIDFYFACNDVFLYDIAVTLNDWCSDDNGSLNIRKAQAYLAAYQKVRKLTASEQSAFCAMLRAGALRFWLSRLVDWHFPREGEMTHSKDPNQFKQILQQRIADEAELERLVA